MRARPVWVMACARFVCRGHGRPSRVGGMGAHRVWVVACAWANARVDTTRASLRPPSHANLPTPPNPSHHLLHHTALPTLSFTLSQPLSLSPCAPPTRPPALCSAPTQLLDRPESLSDARRVLPTFKDSDRLVKHFMQARRP